MTPTSTLIGVRHGETEWNLSGRQQGHLDSPLTKRGIKQAERLAERLLERRIGVICSSDLGRAAQTAEIISKKLLLDFKIDERLRERHLGLMQGLTKEGFEDRHPEEAAFFNSGDPDYVLPGGESARQRYERCVRCAEELATRYIGQNILLIGHGGVLNSFICKALNIPLTEPRRFSLFNGSINSFSIINGQWRLDTWGDIHHLVGMDTLDDQ